jgi:hypothetical protein
MQAMTEVGGKVKLDFDHFDAFAKFCGLMAIGYIAISIHEIWILRTLIKEEVRRAIDNREW